MIDSRVTTLENLLCLPDQTDDWGSIRRGLTRRTKQDAKLTKYSKPRSTQSFGKSCTNGERPRPLLCQPWQHPGEEELLRDEEKRRAFLISYMGEHQNIKRFLNENVQFHWSWHEPKRIKDHRGWVNECKQLPSHVPGRPPDPGPSSLPSFSSFSSLPSLPRWEAGGGSEKENKHF